MLTVDLVAEVVGAAPAVGEAVLGVVADVGGGDQEAASGHSAQSLVRVSGVRAIRFLCNHFKPSFAIRILVSAKMEDSRSPGFRHQTNGEIYETDLNV